MAETLRITQPRLSEAEDRPAPPPPRVAADWPLMGDILTHRMDMPEHLIRWRRAEREREGG